MNSSPLIGPQKQRSGECCQSGIRVNFDQDQVRMGFCACPTGKARRYGIPVTMSAWDAESYVKAGGSNAALTLANQWVDGDPRRWLILQGAYGAGKTGLAVVVYKVLADRIAAKVGEVEFYREHRRLIQFWQVPQLLMAEQKTFGRDGDVVSPLRMAAAAELLVLDDVGAERETEWAHDSIAQIIQERYVNGKRTIITTNLDGKAIRTAFGERVVDRIRDSSLFIVFTSKSLRRTGEVKIV